MADALRPLKGNWANVHAMQIYITSLLCRIFSLSTPYNNISCDIFFCTSHMSTSDDFCNSFTTFTTRLRSWIWRKHLHWLLTSSVESLNKNWDNKWSLILSNIEIQYGDAIWTPPVQAENLTKIQLTQHHPPLLMHCNHASYCYQYVNGHISSTVVKVKGWRG